MRRGAAAVKVATLLLAVTVITSAPTAAHKAAPPAAAPANAPAVAPAPDAGKPIDRRFEELSLALRFPPELHLVEQPAPSDAQVRALWLGRLAQSELRMQLILLSRLDFGFDEPSEVIDVIGLSLADSTAGGDPAFHFDTITHLDGPFGDASYATLARSRETEDDGASQYFRLAGLLEGMAYAVEVRARPALAEPDAKTLCDALAKCIAYDGPKRDPQWTDAEALARWAQDAPDSVAEEKPEVLRSTHYIMLSNSSGGKSFLKKMEECYAAIDKIYPFDEVKGRRLMPVFLFRTNDQYFEFFAKAFQSTVEQAKRSGGVASRDFYSTWYEAPGDPVHIHEATHQIFGNRLALRGGGSWFQEGVAEYMSTKDNERGDAARAVKKGRAPPLREFMAVESLLFSSKDDDKSGADEAGSQYELAALFVEFMHESKFGKAKFQDYIHAVGAVPRNNVRAIEAAVKRVYGVDLAGLESQFVDYCKKR